MLKDFTYKFNEGPFDTEQELTREWNTGNCRPAVQLYLYELRGTFLKPEQILCPKAFKKTGGFVTGNNIPFSFSELSDGDIIYAEGLKNKHDEALDKSLPTFETKDEYLVSLHTALFTGEKNKEIWHATAVEGSSCYWSLEKFLTYYKPIAAKRV